MSDDLEKVYFSLDPSDWHGCTSESLWAERIPGATPGTVFQLRNSPFYARGVSFLDTVRVASRRDGPGYEFAGVIDRSGHSTYMLLASPNSSGFDALWERLQKLGCSYESATRRTSLGQKVLYTVDVPDTTDIYAVYAILAEGKRTNVWMFQEGHVGHKLKSD